MKRNILNFFQTGFAALFMVLLISSCSGPPDLTGERNEVIARSKALVQKEQAKDVEGCTAFFNDDAALQLAGTAQITGKQSITAYYVRLFLPNSVEKDFNSTVKSVTVADSKDIAYETGIQSATVTGPKGNYLDMRKYLAVWEKADGEWRIAALSVTSDAVSGGESK